MNLNKIPEYEQISKRYLMKYRKGDQKRFLKEFAKQAGILTGKEPR